MTSSNGNIFRVTALCEGNPSVPGGFPPQRLVMLCTAQLGGPVLKASGRVQFTPFRLADKSPMIKDQHTAGSSVRQLSQLTKLSPWLTLCTKDITTSFWYYHDDVIKWKHFPRYWPFVRGIHRSPVNSPHKGQWRGALMFTLICARINGWVNNREAGDLRRYRGHYDVSVMTMNDFGFYLIKSWVNIIFPIE